MLDKSIDNVSDINNKEKENIKNVFKDIKESVVSVTRGFKSIMPAETEVLRNAIVQGIDDLIDDLNTYGLFEINDSIFNQKLSELYGMSQNILTNSVVGSVTNGKVNSVLSIKNLPNIDKGITKESKMVFIGIDDYVGTEYDLKGAENDVVKMKETFSKIYGISPENITILLNQNANKANILKTIKEESSHSKGKMLIYYSGHGMSGDNIKNKSTNKSYIVPSNTLPNGDDISMFISPEEFSSVVCSSALVITDMCHAGGFINNLDNNLSGIGSSDKGEAHEIITGSDGDVMGEFSFKFLNLLEQNLSIESAINNLVSK